MNQFLQIILLCFLIIILTGLSMLAFALGMVGKFCISAVFNMAYNLSAEVYPTSVRQVGLSAGSMSGRIGGIAAPYIAYMVS